MHSPFAVSRHGEEEVSVASHPLSMSPSHRFPHSAGLVVTRPVMGSTPFKIVCCILAFLFWFVQTQYWQDFMIIFPG